MNLADMLSYADIHQLSRIASNYECECDGHSKKELIQSILITVGRKDVFERQIDSLSLEDIRFIDSLLFDSRDQFSLEELVARAKRTRFQSGDPPGASAGAKDAKDGTPDGTEEPNPREMIARFKQWGWLFNGYSQQTRYLFQVPSDLKLRFGEALARHYQRKLTYVGEPVVYRDEYRLMEDDILHLLRFVQGQEAALTADGFMYKRTLQQVLDTAAVKEEPVGRGPWRFGYGRKFKEYPSRFSLIYDYVYFQGYLAEADNRLLLTDLGHSFLTEGRRADVRDVYRFWLKLYRGPIPNIASLVHWIEKLAKRWVTAESLRSVLQELIRPYYYDTPASIFDLRIVQMMMHLGLIRVGEDEASGKVLMVTKLGSEIILGNPPTDDETIELAD